MLYQLTSCDDFKFSNQGKYMSKDASSQSKVNFIENPEKSIKDKISILWALMILSFALCFGAAYLVYEEILSNHFGLIVVIAGFFGFVCWGGISSEEDKLVELQSERCPQCKTWHSYLVKNSDVIASWGQWEMRDFVDRTQNAKGELIATTTRKQQVWVDYVRRRYTRECVNCGHSHSWTALD